MICSRIFCQTSQEKSGSRDCSESDKAKRDKDQVGNGVAGRFVPAPSRCFFFGFRFDEAVNIGEVKDLFGCPGL